jgi:protein ImuB
MAVLCVVGPGAWSEREVERVGNELLQLVPRVAVDAAVRRVWADVRGLRQELGVVVVQRLSASVGSVVSCGIARTPVAAYASALAPAPGRVAVVADGTDRAFLSPLSLSVLEPTDRLLGMLEGVGFETCGQLADQAMESIEVRFGAEAVGVWRRARAEDDRRLFREVARERPRASIDFIDYVVTDPERLVFAANALLGGICTSLRERGAHARRLELQLPLANGEVWMRSLVAARPTASRAVWVRLVRGVLERLSVPDAVAGVGLEVEAVEAAATIQGDLFDVGFATAPAVEAALNRLIESHGPILVQPQVSDHPLVERRTEFLALDTALATDAVAWSRGSPLETGPAGNERHDHSDASRAAMPGLTLQVLSEPRRVDVESIERRDHVLPVRYRDEDWKQLITVTGPDHISGGQWEEPYAREYFRGLTADGWLVWLFRDARTGEWFIHGWWD